MHNSTGRRTALTVILMVLMMTVFTQFVSAAPKIDTERAVSVKAYYLKDGIPLRDAEFSIYRIADVSETVKFTLTDDFSSYAVSLDGHDSEGWRDLAYTLEGYIKRDEIGAYASKTSGRDGKVIFSDLKPGLYLISGGRFERSGRIYTTEPFMICAPDRTDADRWDYDPVVQPKISVKSVADKSTAVKVMKVWKDGNSSKRPESVQVQLIGDGKLKYTVTLSKRNGWKYTWKKLDGSISWHVVEKTVPENYKVSSMIESDTFVITNRLDNDNEKEKEKEKLPQTGVLWWPCLALFTAGAACLIAGMTVRKHRNGR